LNWYRCGQCGEGKGKLLLLFLREENTKLLSQKIGVEERRWNRDEE